MSLRATRAEIDIPNLYSNLAFFRGRLSPGVRLCLAVKGNAYGHGLVGLSLWAQPRVDTFAVATVDEAAALRSGGIHKPILLLSPHSREEIPRILALDLEPFVSHNDFLADYQHAAEKHGRSLRLHLKVDTGMNRAGVWYDEALPLARQIANGKSLELFGLCTHFASAYASDMIARADTENQLRRFQAILRQLHREGISVPCVHAANSAATLHYPAAHFDMVRIGIGAYGYCDGTGELRPVLSLKTKIGLIKRVPSGAKVSYGGTWQAKRDSVLALLPIGYADGYSRQLSNRGQVWLDGALYPVVGRVCMDQTMIDVSDHPHPATLSEKDVQLIGPEPNAEFIAEQTGTISYEVLTSIGQRVPRIYLE
ncbi:alanine racemase [Candidatus Haliotispira prima]|uniref:Alanine racemase n=1 Tax=Candidatus Haliotispira prima TaxID=3034016 RepID=A0ABY8MIT4_9SPIO|nr:alanine racemase [Candidatus Haliotispira prima]